MKSLAATVLILLLAVTPVALAASADERPAAENTANILPIADDLRVAERDAATPIASALDLSLFGIISLGVLGLFWIRRHTSEL